MPENRNHLNIYLPASEASREVESGDVRAPGVSGVFIRSEYIWHHETRVHILVQASFFKVKI